jgi:superfamily I DNA/RNA helicase
MEATWWTRPSQLDDDQREVVALPAHGDYLVVGPPGSGKTNLLLLRATFLDRLKIRNIAVLTFNRILREFLASGTSTTSFDAGKIYTYVGWGARVLRQNGDALERGRDFEAVRARITDSLAALSDAAVNENRLDCILLDEAQDYTVEEIRVIRRFSRQIFAVGDDRQRIYRADGALEELEDICGRARRLRFNYRNGLKICRLADGIRNEVDQETGLEASSNYDEQSSPSSVAVHGSISLSDQVSRAVVEIRTQLRAYQAGILGILTPRLSEFQDLAALLKESTIAEQVQAQHFSSGYVPFSPSRRVVLSTIHGAKGLEFRALHLLAMDTIKGFPLQKKLAYTAVTRAKTSLSIYHERALPGYLEKGLAALDTSPARPPDLSDLFTR